MKFFVRLFLPLIASCNASAATEPPFTLVVPADEVQPAQRVYVDLLAVNPSRVSVPFAPPPELSGTVRAGDRSWPVTLAGEGVSPNAVAASGFAVRRYEMTVPREAAGTATLEIVRPGQPALRAVLVVGEKSSADNAVANTPLGEWEASTEVASLLPRAFAGRFAPNLPVYFVYGEGGQAAKFQFSFDYRLATLHWDLNAKSVASRLYLGYSQRSLWDIEASSSPFYDTSYMPEISIDTLALLPEDAKAWFSWYGVRFGLQHESNGRSGVDSRSLNIGYLRTSFVLGELGGWHAVLHPEIHTYLGDLENNPRIKNYRGYGKLALALNRDNAGLALLASIHTGRDFRNLTYQLDLTIPVQQPLLNLETFFTVQYFHGYGESLLDYESRSSALRVGLTFVR